MGRPQIKDVRRQQILDAFEQCVIRYGVEGATLAKIAEQANLARPLVRHNIGNKEELTDALITRFLQKSRKAMDGMIDALGEKYRAKTVVEWLFNPDYSDASLAKISYALIVAAGYNPVLADAMQTWLDDFISRINDVIADEYADVDPEKVTAVAAGITGIYFNVESFYTLGNHEALVASSKKAALILLVSLDEKQ